MEAVIQVRNLIKYYGKELVLDSVSLEVYKGESIGIVGPNGAGKSTLLKIIAGIESYDSGELVVKGRIGFVPQETILLPWRTLRSNILLAAKLRKIPRDEADEKLERASRILGITEYLDYYPGQVSGGTARKAQILMALIVNPDILLLDEPFTGLDANAIEALQSTLRELRETFELTVVTVSHMIDELMALSDRIYVLTHKPARVKQVINLQR
jgi:NitT/TauT family transport system ATP-binding protein